MGFRRHIRTFGVDEHIGQPSPHMLETIHTGKGGGGRLNILLHYPTSEQAFAELQKQVAKIHAEAVGSFVDKLTCPKEQKLRLVEAVQEIAQTQ